MEATQQSDLLAAPTNSNEPEQGIVTGKELEKLFKAFQLAFKTQAEHRQVSERLLADALSAGYRYAVATPDPADFNPVFFSHVPEKEQQRVANALIALCGGITRTQDGGFVFTPEQSFLSFTKKNGFTFTVQGNSKAARALRHERRLRAHAAFAAFSGNVLAVFNVKPPKVEKALAEDEAAKRIARIIGQMAAGSRLKDKLSALLADEGFKEMLATNKVNASKK